MAINYKKAAPLAVGGAAILGLTALRIRAANAAEPAKPPEPQSPKPAPAASLPPPIPVVKPAPVPPPPAPPVIGPGGVPLTPTVSGPKAIVTTNDPAPAGDLIIRTQPNSSAPQIPGGGADKEGIVTVIRKVDDTWSEVYWPGGRRPGGQGFAAHRYLRPVSNEVIPPAAVIGRKAVVTTNDPAPAGDLIVRSQPNPTATQIGGADKGGTVTIIREVDGTWAEVLWPGGRHPKVQGFVRKAYLRVL
jgi:hypothetical protein